MLLDQCKLVLVLTTIGLVAAPVSGQQGQPTPKRRQQIDQLVQQLDSKYIVKREAARKELLLLGVEALPALEKVLTGPDTPLRQRAERLVGELRAQCLARATAQLLGKTDRAGVDTFVAYLTAKGGDADAADWAALQKAIATLTGQAGRPLKFDLEGGPVVPVTRPLTLARGKVVAAGAVTCRSVGNAVVVAGGPVTINDNVFGAAIFANGDVYVRGQLVDSLVVCDGDVTVGSDAVRSVILARGAVKFGRPFDSVLAAGGAIQRWNKTAQPRVRAQEARLLAWFFEPARAGVTVTTVQGAVRVEQVTADSALARAGLRKGDTVTAVDGTGVATAEAFRRALRRQWLLGRALLRLRRGDATLQLSVRLVD